MPRRPQPVLIITQPNTQKVWFSRRLHFAVREFHASVASVTLGLQSRWRTADKVLWTDVYFSITLFLCSCLPSKLLLHDTSHNCSISSLRVHTVFLAPSLALNLAWFFHLDNQLCFRKFVSHIEVEHIRCLYSICCQTFVKSGIWQFWQVHALTRAGDCPGCLSTYFLAKNKQRQGLPAGWMAATAAPLGFLPV